MGHIDPHNAFNIFLVIGMFAAGLTYLFEECLLHRFHAVYAWIPAGITMILGQGHMVYNDWLASTAERPLATIIGEFAARSPGVVSWLLYFIPLYVGIGSLIMAYSAHGQDRREQGYFDRRYGPREERLRWN